MPALPEEMEPESLNYSQKQRNQSEIITKTKFEQLNEKRKFSESDLVKKVL